MCVSPLFREWNVHICEIYTNGTRYGVSRISDLFAIATNDVPVMAMMMMMMIMIWSLIFRQIRRPDGAGVSKYLLREPIGGGKASKSLECAVNLVPIEH